MKAIQKSSKKNNFILAFTLSFYFFFVLGFIFHTSAHPVLFGKYTIKYFFLLVGLVIFSPALFIIVQKLTFKFTKRKIIILVIFFLIIVLAVSETFLRIKYRNYESYIYAATIDNFDRFLQ